MLHKRKSRYLSGTRTLWGWEVRTAGVGAGGEETLEALPRDFGMPPIPFCHIGSGSDSQGYSEGRDFSSQTLLGNLSDVQELMELARKRVGSQVILRLLPSRNWVALTRDRVRGGQPRAGDLPGVWNRQGQVCQVKEQTAGGWSWPVPCG